MAQCKVRLQLCAIVFALLLLDVPTECAQIRVKPDGSDAAAGSNWATAKKTIQAGIDAAGTGGEVWVAKGTYSETIAVPDGVGVYGGFVGVESSLSERPDFPRTAPDPNESIIDGNGVGSTVTPAPGATNGTVVDGFTIRGGIGTSSEGSRRGGGIYCSGSSPTIRYNTVTLNSASLGGGIYCESGSPVIRENEIIGNTATDSGGGIYCIDANPDILNNFIRGNTADNGGGVEFVDSTATLASNAIIGNRARYNGGGVHCQGPSAPGIVNNTFAANKAVKGGAVYCGFQCSPTVRNSLVSGNQADQGSCAWRDATSSLDFAYCCFWENGAEPFYPAAWNPIGSNDNFESDPLFLAPWVDEYHLRSGSLCVNAGDDSALGVGWTDLDGKQRKLGTHVDVGCFEWDSSPYWVRRISEARALPYDLEIELRGKPVTAVFDGAFYLEDYSRAGGIRVISAAAVTRGDLVTASGPVGLNEDAELQVNADTVSIEAGNASNVPSPLGMANWAIGGAGYYFSLEFGQPGLVYGLGLNNIGLLVKTWGEVTDHGADWFQLDDGSGVDDDISSKLGVFVQVPNGVPVPSNGEYVAVTGISSCVLVGDLLGVLLARDGGDIRVL